MISVAAEHAGDYLIADYKSFDLLFPRHQCGTSVVGSNLEIMQSPFPFWDSKLTFQNKNICAYNLDAWLRQFFKIYADSSLNLALIIAIDKFAFPEAVRAGLKSFKGDFNLDFVAIKVTGRMKIASWSEKEVYPIPATLKHCLANSCLKGLRFEGTDRLQYFMDIESILVDSFFNVSSR